MSTSPDLPTPITPAPGEMPVEPDKGPGNPGNPAGPLTPLKLVPEQAFARFAANRFFMQAAAFRWSGFPTPVLIFSR